MKLKQTILYIVMLALLAVAIFSLVGCTIHYKPDILMNPVSEKINSIELTGTAKGEIAGEDIKLDLVLTGQGEVVHIVKKEVIIMEVTNYWAWETIKGIFISIGTLLWIWLWHILAVTLLICILTELSGLWGKAKWVGKRGLTIFWGAAGIAFYCLVFKADLWVAVIFSTGCVILSNISWEWIWNKFLRKVKDKIKKK